MDISFTVCLFFVCTVTDFSSQPKASGVKLCRVVQGHPGQESPILGNCFPRSPKSDESACGGNYC